MLASLSAIDLLLWAATTSLSVALLAINLLRKQQAQFPLFTTYLVVNLLQTAIQIYIYKSYGINSDVAYSVVWSSHCRVRRN